MNLSNKLTMMRVFLIPVYLVILYVGFPGATYVALAVFVAACITDWADGHIARARNETTDFGKFMDPLADKILVISAMVMFTASGIMPAWAVVIVIAREFAVSGLRLVAVDNGRVVAAAWFGKVKTVATMICVGLMHFPLPVVLNWICVVVIAGTTVFSGIEYFVKNRDVLNWKK